MANLDESETYASAALFTLALYSSQVEVGVDRFQENALGEYRASAWGCPPDLDLDEVLFGENLSQEHLTHFWGWDCCGTGGLCQSIYSNLNIPQKRWTGLLKTPETVGDISTDTGVDELIHIVERYSQMLDPELKYTKGTAVAFFSIQRQRSIDVGELDVVAAGCVHEEETQTPSIRRAESKKLPEIDEGIYDDTKLPLLKTTESTNKWPMDSQPNEEAGEKLIMQPVSVFANEPALECQKDNSEPESGSGSDGAYEAYIDGLQQQDFQEDETEDVVIPKVGFTPRSDYDHPAAGASCLALRALIKATLLDNALKPQTGELDVHIQWYDARCRIALMRMAHWLRIPWSTMAAFEAEAALDLLKLKDTESVSAKSVSVSRWLKISAMAIGGGAAVAFTGGLAAPAVAAGLGAAVTLAGGGAATASAVTGFAASTAGTATITTAFGAFGAHSTGSTMYNRTNNVKEFAFWDLSMDWDIELQKKTEAAAKKASRFWPWRKKTQAAQSKPNPRSASMSALPLNDGTPDSMDTSTNDTSTTLEPANLPPTGQSEPATPEAGALVHAPVSQKKVTVVPGVEVDLDDLEPTHARSNYTEWWDSLLRSKERPDLLRLPVNVRGDDSNLALIIALSGVIQDDKHFIDPWKKLPSVSCDRFAVVWETKLLKKVSDALVGLITSQVANEAGKWFIKKYLYTGLLAAVAIPVLITTLVDVTVGNSWGTAMDRSLKAGELLAQYLLEGLHGHRPVTLIGYSFGARAIFRCLLTLYNAGKRGIIENVILLGAPVSMTDEKWARARSVVAGRFVNGYSTRDWVLGIVFRIGRGVMQKVAGIAPVQVPGIENIDLSAIVGGQTEYAACMKDILIALHL